MQCKQCGEIVTKDMLFCGNCGCPVTQESEETSIMHCPNCGNVINEGDIFCGECGYKVELSEHSVSSATESIPMSPEPEKVEKTKDYIKADADSAIEDTVLKSTLSPREQSKDATLYSEGKKFLKTAGDIE